MKSTELRVVSFHGDEIVTFEAEGGRYVAMRRIVENMGLAWPSQSVKLEAQKAKFSCFDIVTTGADGKSYSMVAMPVEKLPLWLASINPNKIKDAAIRSKVERYQAESAIALHDYWTKGAAVRGDLDGIVTDLSPDARKVMGGVFKSVLTKAIAEIVPALVREQIGSRQHAVVAGVSAGQVLEMAGIDRRKGLRGMAVFISHRLRRFHASRGVAVNLATLGSSHAYVFDPLLSREWLANGGKTEIEAKVAERRGHGTLNLRLVRP